MFSGVYEVGIAELIRVRDSPVNQLMNSKLYMWDESQLRVSVKAAAV